MKKEKQNDVEETKSTFMQKILYLFIIPLMFVSILILGYLTYQGQNVFEMAKAFVPEKKETATIQEEKDDEPIINTSDEEKEATVSSPQEVILLEREVSEKQREIEKLLSQLKQANERIATLENEQQEVKASTKELAKLYEGMSTRKAAQIIQELDEEMALIIFKELSTAKASSILGQIEPQMAARFTTLLANEE
ncbi:MotE family protein [Sutcliffiella rhizosphaerae]|uniref:Magnesium transporter MgtE intracellular domain-containing protein n=1 Tax=Sutcliffiella rhizosphaerae TaxID=2880967 RepID=A0ABM8YII0_9BACI|nr:hypothetical protein [Sutcliffiella rhizosphaerae]CAG9619708.1 hypothetical protein BACCIP111883_00476 [Sutcliffiella rhizosphaerae]